MNRSPRHWPLRTVALAGLAACAGATLMLATHRSTDPVIGSLSPIAAIAMMLALAGAVASACFMFASPNRLARFAAWFSVQSAPLRITPPNGSPRVGTLLGILALATYAFIGVRMLCAQSPPGNDELDYLRVAAEMREMGLAEFTRRLWLGTYGEANRHPLYPLLLVPVQSFAAARWLSFGLGLVPLGVVWWLGVRSAGWLAGGVVAVLLATNSVCLQSATIVACEIILLTWTVLAWFTAAGAFRTSSRIPVQAVAVGGWLGLAYLTKASALFLVVGFVIASMSLARLRRWSWLAMVGFAVLASPLIARNVQAFGDPLYSYNTRFLFADSFDEGVRMDFRGTWSAARDYVGSHSASEIAGRALSGLGWEGLILLRSLGPATCGESRPLVGMVVLLAACVGVIGSDRREVGLLAVWLAMFYGFFAWYVPIAAGDRFLAPLVPPLLFYSGRGVVALVAASATPDRVTRRVVVVALLWCVTIALLGLRQRGVEANDAAIHSMIRSAASSFAP